MTEEQKTLTKEELLTEIGDFLDTNSAVNPDIVKVCLILGLKIRDRAIASNEIDSLINSLMPKAADT